MPYDASPYHRDLGLIQIDQAAAYVDLRYFVQTTTTLLKTVLSLISLATHVKRMAPSDS